MEHFRFKTNINCNSCKSAVAPFLNSEPGVDKWDVDLDSPDRILRVSGSNISSDKITDLVRSAGYSVQEIK